MLRPGVTQEWVDEGELSSGRTKNRRWRRPYDVDKIMRRYDQELPGASSTLVYDTTRRRAMDSRSECRSIIEVGLRENRIDASPATRWRRPCMRVTIYLSIDQGELLGGHSGVEAGGRKGQGSDNESSGAQLPKSKASVGKAVDSEEHHSAAEADLPIVKEGIQM
ncbi:hypothetical protein B296_00044666 [Ensete ventricosum]|uniref:Uncharacterized protein n=1 Tax=Ensete ventricosum TaxID=4639 RepID=A0A426WX18_ENSVE|nr:hypothetical protein B296_00044666 [Ensete ventricosum]